MIFIILYHLLFSTVYNPVSKITSGGIYNSRPAQTAQLGAYIIWDNGDYIAYDDGSPIAWSE